LKIENSILKVLAYFEVFRYPLTIEEVKSFLDQPLDKEELNKTLGELVRTQRVFQLDEFYSLQNDLSIADRRKKGNLYAASLLHKAERIAKTLYRFPYVRAVGVSGSVSKYFADEDADIDYFIITKANRLWVARTLLHIFKKIPLLKYRNQHYCMNYFIDEAELLIEEKNIYTATELFTIIPVAGNGSMKNFFEKNSWSFTYFPNRSLPLIRNNLIKTDPWFKRLTEFILNNKLGDWFDSYFLKITTRRWRKKEEEHRLNTKGERMGLKTGKHYSKPNPVFFHDWFLNSYEKKLVETKEKWNI
jgi:hypothetical protein